MFDADKQTRLRCMSCSRCIRDSFGSPDCPHHLVPVVGMDCFSRRLTPSYSSPDFASPVSGADAVKSEKEQVYRVKIRAVKVQKSGLCEVIEMCPHCERENSFLWDIAKEGFMAFCPGCGERLMLCSECAGGGENCDYNDYSDYCHKMDVVKNGGDK